jgi:hypothetical protein
VLGEDVAFLLYLVPIVASVVYGAYEWFQIAPNSSSMPTTAYLIVSKSPYLFILSLAAVCVALIIEVRTSAIASRPAIVSANVTRMQMLALVSLFVSLVAGISAAGYGDLVTGFGNFLAGRYVLIYAFFLLGTSILISPNHFLVISNFGAILELIGLILIAISPIIIYAGLKIHLSFSESGILSLVTLIVGLILFASKGMKSGKSKPQKQIARTA